MIDIKVPASTSNLGPGFDVLGLALKRYLRVSVSERDENDVGPHIEINGDGTDEISTGEDNLIWRVMQFAAGRKNVAIPPIKLIIENEIPLSRGLGSSAAAIVA